MKKLILIFILSLSLFSCTSKNKIVIDYSVMGFPYDLDEPYNIEYQQLFLEDYWRTEGTLYPYKNETLQLIDWSIEERLLVRSDIEGYLTFFNQDTYTIYSRNEIESYQQYYVDAIKVEDEYQIIFYRENVNTITWNIRPGDFIDVIESNGVYSYVINKQYLGFSEIDNKEHNYRIFYAIYHAENLPYMVYFDSNYIYLINRDDAFSKACITSFENNTDVQLFKN